MKFDIKSAGVGFGLLAMITFLTMPGTDSEDDNFDDDKLVQSLPEFDFTGNEVAIDSETLLGRYEVLSTKPKPKQDQANKAKPKPRPKKKVIDKTIYPFYAQYDEDHQMGLAGTFFDEGAFAVIQLINFETKKSTFHDVKEGTKFGPFTVKKLHREEIVLASEKAEMTLTMFKKRK